MAILVNDNVQITYKIYVSTSVWIATIYVVTVRLLKLLLNPIQKHTAYIIHKMLNFKQNMIMVIRTNPMPNVLKFDNQCLPY